MSDEDSSDINASILDIKHNDQVDEFITSEPTSKVNDIHKKIENLRRSSLVHKDSQSSDRLFCQSNTPYVDEDMQSDGYGLNHESEHQKKIIIGARRQSRLNLPPLSLHTVSSNLFRIGHDGEPLSPGSPSDLNYENQSNHVPDHHASSLNILSARSHHEQFLTNQPSAAPEVLQLHSVISPRDTELMSPSSANKHVQNNQNNNNNNNNNICETAIVNNLNTKISNHHHNHDYQFLRHNSTPGIAEEVTGFSSPRINTELDSAAHNSTMDPAMSHIHSAAMSPRTSNSQLPANHALQRKRLNEAVGEIFRRRRESIGAFSIINNNNHSQINNNNLNPVASGTTELAPFLAGHVETHVSNQSHVNNSYHQYNDQNLHYVNEENRNTATVGMTVTGSSSNGCTSIFNNTGHFHSTNNSRGGFYEHSRLSSQPEQGLEISSSSHSKNNLNNTNSYSPRHHHSVNLPPNFSISSACLPSFPVLHTSDAFSSKQIPANTQNQMQRKSSTNQLSSSNNTARVNKRKAAPTAINKSDSGVTQIVRSLSSSSKSSSPSSSNFDESQPSGNGVPATPLKPQPLTLASCFSPLQGSAAISSRILFNDKYTATNHHHEQNEEASLKTGASIASAAPLFFPQPSFASLLPSTQSPLFLSDGGVQQKLLPHQLLSIIEMNSGSQAERLGAFSESQRMAVSEIVKTAIQQVSDFMLINSLTSNGVNSNPNRKSSLGIITSDASNNENISSSFSYNNRRKVSNILPSSPNSFFSVAKRGSLMSTIEPNIHNSNNGSNTGNGPLSPPSILNNGFMVGMSNGGNLNVDEGGMNNDADEGGDFETAGVPNADAEKDELSRQLLGLAKRCAVTEQEVKNLESDLDLALISVEDKEYEIQKFKEEFEVLLKEKEDIERDYDLDLEDAEAELHKVQLMLEIALDEKKDLKQANSDVGSRLANLEISYAEVLKSKDHVVSTLEDLHSEMKGMLIDAANREKGFKKVLLETQAALVAAVNRNEQLRIDLTSERTLNAQFRARTISAAENIIGLDEEANQILDSIEFNYASSSNHLNTGRNSGALSSSLKDPYHSGSSSSALVLSDSSNAPSNVTLNIGNANVLHRVPPLLAPSPYMTDPQLSLLAPSPCTANANANTPSGGGHSSVSHRFVPRASFAKVFRYESNNFSQSPSNHFPSTTSNINNNNVNTNMHIASSTSPLPVASPNSSSMSPVDLQPPLPVHRALQSPFLFSDDDENVFTGHSLNGVNSSRDYIKKSAKGRHSRIFSGSVMSPQSDHQQQQLHPNSSKFFSHNSDYSPVVDYSSPNNVNSKRPSRVHSVWSMASSIRQMHLISPSHHSLNGGAASYNQSLQSYATGDGVHTLSKRTSIQGNSPPSMRRLVSKSLAEELLSRCEDDDDDDDNQSSSSSSSSLFSLDVNNKQDGDAIVTSKDDVDDSFVNSPVSIPINSLPPQQTDFISPKITSPPKESLSPNALLIDQLTKKNPYNYMDVTAANQIQTQNKRWKSHDAGLCLHNPEINQNISTPVGDHIVTSDCILNEDFIHKNEDKNDALKTGIENRCLLALEENSSLSSSNSEDINDLIDRVDDQTNQNNKSINTPSRNFKQQGNSKNNHRSATEMMVRSDVAALVGRIMDVDSEHENIINNNNNNDNSPHGINPNLSNTQQVFVGFRSFLPSQPIPISSQTLADNGNNSGPKLESDHNCNIVNNGIMANNPNIWVSPLIISSSRSSDPSALSPQQSSVVAVSATLSSSHINHAISRATTGAGRYIPASVGTFTSSSIIGSNNLKQPADSSSNAQPTFSSGVTEVESLADRLLKLQRDDPFLSSTYNDSSHQGIPSPDFENSASRNTQAAVEDAFSVSRNFSNESKGIQIGSIPMLNRKQFLSSPRSAIKKENNDAPCETVTLDVNEHSSRSHAPSAPLFTGKRKSVAILGVDDFSPAVNCANSCISLPSGDCHIRKTAHSNFSSTLHQSQLQDASNLLQSPFSKKNSSLSMSPNSASPNSHTILQLADTHYQPNFDLKKDVPTHSASIPPPPANSSLLPGERPVFNLYRITVSEIRLLVETLLAQNDDVLGPIRDNWKRLHNLLQLSAIREARKKDIAHATDAWRASCFNVAILEGLLYNCEALPTYQELTNHLDNFLMGLLNKMDKNDPLVAKLRTQGLGKASHSAGLRSGSGFNGGVAFSAQQSMEEDYELEIEDLGLEIVCEDEESLGAANIRVSDNNAYGISNAISDQAYHELAECHRMNNLDSNENTTFSVQDWVDMGLVNSSSMFPNIPSEQRSTILHDTAVLLSRVSNSITVHNSKPSFIKKSSSLNTSTNDQGLKPPVDSLRFVRVALGKAIEQRNRLHARLERLKDEDRTMLESEPVIATFEVVSELNKLKSVVENLTNQLESERSRAEDMSMRHSEMTTRFGIFLNRQEDITRGKLSDLLRFAGENSADSDVWKALQSTVQTLEAVKNENADKTRQLMELTAALNAKNEQRAKKITLKKEMLKQALLQQHSYGRNRIQSSHHKLLTFDENSLVKSNQNDENLNQKHFNDSTNNNLLVSSPSTSTDSNSSSNSFVSKLRSSPKHSTAPSSLLRNKIRAGLALEDRSFKLSFSQPPVDTVPVEDALKECDEVESGHLVSNGSLRDDDDGEDDDERNILTTALSPPMSSVDFGFSQQKQMIVNDVRGIVDLIIQVDEEHGHRQNNKFIEFPFSNKQKFDDMSNNNNNNNTSSLIVDTRMSSSSPNVSSSGVHMDASDPPQAQSSTNHNRTFTTLALLSSAPSPHIQPILSSNNNNNNTTNRVIFSSLKLDLRNAEHHSSTDSQNLLETHLKFLESLEISDSSSDGISDIHNGTFRGPMSSSGRFLFRRHHRNASQMSQSNHHLSVSESGGSQRRHIASSAAASPMSSNVIRSALKQSPRRNSREDGELCLDTNNEVNVQTFHHSVRLSITAAPTASESSSVIFADSTEMLDTFAETRWCLVSSVSPNRSLPTKLSNINSHYVANVRQPFADSSKLKDISESLLSSTSHSSGSFRPSYDGSGSSRPANLPVSPVSRWLPLSRPPFMPIHSKPLHDLPLIMSGPPQHKLELHEKILVVAVSPPRTIPQGVLSSPINMHEVNSIAHSAAQSFLSCNNLVVEKSLSPPTKFLGARVSMSPTANRHIPNLHTNFVSQNTFQDDDDGSDSSRKPEFKGWLENSCCCPASPPHASPSASPLRTGSPVQVLPPMKIVRSFPYSDRQLESVSFDISGITSPHALSESQLFHELNKDQNQSRFDNNINNRARIINSPSSPHTNQQNRKVLFLWQKCSH